MRRGFVLAAATAAAGALLSLSGSFLELEETVGLRTLFALRGPLMQPAAVTVVGISAEAAARVQQPPELDEWSRSVHADLVDRLAAAGAAAIVFDMSFETERNAADDRRLAAAIGRAGNVILWQRVVTESLAIPGRAVAGTAEMETRVPPLAPLDEAAWGTAPFMLPRVPIRVNQFWAFGRSLGGTPTLPTVALQAYLAADFGHLAAAVTAAVPELVGPLPSSEAELRASDLELVVRHLRDAFRREPGLAETMLEHLRQHAPRDVAARLRPLIRVYAGGDAHYLNYYGPARTIETLPYDDALKKPLERLVPDVAGRVVFVGYSERRQPEQQDEFYSVFSERSGQSLSGVEIGATAFANMLEMRSLAVMSVPLQLALVALWGSLLGALFGAWGGTRAVAVGAAAGGAYFGGAYWAFGGANLLVPLVAPLLVQLPFALIVGAVWHYRVVRAQSDRIRTALGHYVPQRVADRLAHETLTARSRGDLLHGTCLFTDAEQYTAVAESMDPRALGAFMNDYYESMFRAVDRNAGEIADLAGDSMVAIWPSADDDPESRIRACRAALDVSGAVRQFNESRGRPGLHTRIGLDAGPVFLGNIGAERRFEYRAVGDIVSTASRVQGLNRLLRTQILVSDAALPAGAGFVTREIGFFRLRGKSVPVRVHELLDADAPGRELAELCELFGAALAEFKAARWMDAARAFEAVLARFPADGPAGYYLDLAARFRAAPPESWAGVVAVEVK